MMPMYPQSHTALELFSGGVGGWRYACEEVGLDVIAACEVDPWRRQVYAAVHGERT